MFADLDESIRDLLVQRGNLNAGEVDIAFDMPTRDWAAGMARPTVNVYLYDLRQNFELRNPSAWQVRRGDNNTAVKSRPDVRIDVAYSITAFANAVEDEHRLLGRVLVTLLQHPIIPEDLLRGEVAGQEIRTAIGHPSKIFQSPADYWGSLDSDIRPSLDYRLTVSVDVSQEITVGLALTSIFKLGQIDETTGKAELFDLPLQFGGRIHERDNAEAGIEGVAVTLLERALDTVTDDEGRYTFHGVPPGEYTLIVTAPGMEERRERIEVPSNQYDVGL
ncbi:MAG: DUF4255 domain-containing protein [Chloroflexi bacterium]|nr:DUF4255 domain-containing protein [Chloroflexota bacterium]